MPPTDSCEEHVVEEQRDEDYDEDEAPGLTASGYTPSPAGGGDTLLNVGGGQELLHRHRV